MTARRGGQHPRRERWAAPPAATDRARAWLVTGPLGRGLSFAIDFALALRRGLLQRRG